MTNKNYPSGEYHQQHNLMAKEHRILWVVRNPTSTITIKQRAEIAQIIASLSAIDASLAYTTDRSRDEVVCAEKTLKGISKRGTELAQIIDEIYQDEEQYSLFDREEKIRLKSKNEFVHWE